MLVSRFVRSAKWFGTTELLCSLTRLTRKALHLRSLEQCLASLRKLGSLPGVYIECPAGAGFQGGRAPLGLIVAVVRLRWGGLGRVMTNKSCEIFAQFLRVS